METSINNLGISGKIYIASFTECFSICDLWPVTCDLWPVTCERNLPFFLPNEVISYVHKISFSAALAKALWDFQYKSAKT